MENSENSIDLIVIDLELVYDTWSLLFCITRHVLMNRRDKIFLSNQDYQYIVNKSLKSCLQDLKVAFSLDDDDIRSMEELFNKN
jgi:hypothetical protein